MAAAEKSAICRKRAWVHGYELFMYRVCNDTRLFLGVCAPKQKNYWRFLAVKLGNHSVGKYFPALILMAVRLTRPHGKHGVQQQHALLSPACAPARVRGMGPVLL